MEGPVIILDATAIDSRDKIVIDGIWGKSYWRLPHYRPCRMKEVSVNINGDMAHLKEGLENGKFVGSPVMQELLVRRQVWTRIGRNVSAYWEVS
jgi:hypothetical protein